MEAPACSNSNVESQWTEAERLLVQALRTWDTHFRADNADGVAAAQQQIKEILEWFICECLSHDPSSLLGGWWSDGVTHLRIGRQNNRKHTLRGTTWIATDGIAPFDFDLTLADHDGQRFDRKLFRIGLLDVHGTPVLCDSGWAVERVLELCPRYNRDWAMAVELTPSAKRDRTR